MHRLTILALAAVFAASVAAGAVLAAVPPEAAVPPDDGGGGGGGGIICQAVYNANNDSGEAILAFPPVYTYQTGYLNTAPEGVNPSGYWFEARRFDADWNETFRGVWDADGQWHYSPANSIDVYRYSWMRAWGANSKMSMVSYARDHC